MTAKPRSLYYIMRYSAIIVQSLALGATYVYLSSDSLPLTVIWQRAVAATLMTISLVVCICTCYYNETNLLKLRRQCAIPDNCLTRIPMVGYFVSWHIAPANIVRYVAIGLHLQRALVGSAPFLLAIYTVILRYIVNHDDFLKFFKDLKHKLANLIPRRAPQIA